MWLRRSLLLSALLVTTSAAAQQAEPLPPGHPPVAEDPHPGSFDTGAPSGGGQGDFMQAPPQDRSSEDPELPVGTIAARIVDPQGAPLRDTQVTLGILENTVAKGESRRRELAMTDADGNVRWNNLTNGSGIAYRISVMKDGATFALPPFQLGAERGVRGLLHVYPVTKNIEEALIVSQTALYVEIKDDRVQLEQAIAIGNFGRKAWLPDNLILKMPADLRAFNAEQSMTDIGVDHVEGKGVRLRGTFSPGEHQVVFRWQLPYAGERTLSMEVELAPHTAQTRVMASAAQTMRLEVDGMGEPRSRDLQGQRVLEVTREMRRDEPPMKALSVHLRDIPEAGLPRWAIQAGLAIAALSVLATLAATRHRKLDRSSKAELRERLLEELAELERAHRGGDVGPKTYERLRRDLLDRIALTLAEEPAASPAEAAQA